MVPVNGSTLYPLSLEIIVLIMIQDLVLNFRGELFEHIFLGPISAEQDDTYQQHRLLVKE